MAECELRPLIEQTLASCMAVDAGGVKELGRMKGAYALLLHLPVPVRFERRGIAPAVMSGWFVYAGSAHGGGGVAARLSRHFRRDKVLRWHIDELTNAVDSMMAFAVPEGRECDIVDGLLRTGAFETALSGFGSSDCRRCNAHLLVPRARRQS